MNINVKMNPCFKEVDRRLNEKTIRNITLGKFKSNRKGYTITAIAKGGDAL